MFATSRVGRLAPGPTGLLHLGHARTFVLGWLHIRSLGGKIVLRIEDLDGPRVRKDFVAAAVRDLEWLGLDWDGRVELQSKGVERIRAALSSLVGRGLAYPCVCSRNDVRAAERAPGVYPGTCRGRFESVEAARLATGKDAGLRFRVPAEPVAVDDLLAGCLSFDVAEETGDFLIGRRDGIPAYQLAVVVDDHAQHVTDVVRGQDLLPSTPRQILLQRALGFATPRYAHLPLVLDPEGHRYAKHHDSLSLASLRAAGADPRRIVEWVALGIGRAQTGRVWPLDLVPGFRIDQVSPRPVRLDEETLRALASS